MDICQSLIPNLKLLLSKEAANLGKAKLKALYGGIIEQIGQLDPLSSPAADLAKTVMGEYVNEVTADATELIAEEIQRMGRKGAAEYAYISFISRMILGSLPIVWLAMFENLIQKLKRSIILQIFQLHQLSRIMSFIARKLRKLLDSRLLCKRYYRKNKHVVKYLKMANKYLILIVEKLKKDVFLTRKYRTVERSFMLAKRIYAPLKDGEEPTAKDLENLMNGEYWKRQHEKALEKIEKFWRQNVWILQKYYSALGIISKDILSTHFYQEGPSSFQNPVRIYYNNGTYELVDPTISFPGFKIPGLDSPSFTLESNPFQITSILYLLTGVKNFPTWADRWPYGAIQFGKKFVGPFSRIQMETQKLLLEIESKNENPCNTILFQNVWYIRLVVLDQVLKTLLPRDMQNLINQDDYIRNGFHEMRLIQAELEALGTYDISVLGKRVIKVCTGILGILQKSNRAKGLRRDMKKLRKEITLYRKWLINIYKIIRGFPHFKRQALDDFITFLKVHGFDNYLELVEGGRIKEAAQCLMDYGTASLTIAGMAESCIRGLAGKENNSTKRAQLNQMADHLKGRKQRQLSMRHGKVDDMAMNNYFKKWESSTKNMKNLLSNYLKK